MKLEVEIAKSCERRAFSLVEILLVVAVIGIVSALVLPQVLEVKSSAEVSVARQQQAQLQTALDSWIAANSGSGGGLAAARTSYNGTTEAKLQLLQGYLQKATYSSLSGNGETITSAALDSANAYLEFSEWPLVGRPSVQWVNK